MLILHEDLAKEAERIAKRFKEVYGFDSELIGRDLTRVFTEISEFNGFWSSSLQLCNSLREYGNKKVLVVTPRDIYVNNVSQDDDWIFGYCSENFTLVSTARIKSCDSKSSASLEVPEEQYMRRLEALAIHEVGHDVVSAPHLKLATWINNQSGHELLLGFHCTDNTCIMYEVVDIRSPKKEEGYMRLGTEKKYDAGLDDVLERINPKWFCDKCRQSISVDESYR